VLKEFEAAGLVTLGYRRIRLRNSERLQHLTGSASQPVRLVPASSPS